MRVTLIRYTIHGVCSIEDFDFNCKILWNHCGSGMSRKNLRGGHLWFINYLKAHRDSNPSVRCVLRSFTCHRFKIFQKLKTPKLSSMFAVWVSHCRARRTLWCRGKGSRRRRRRIRRGPARAAALAGRRGSATAAWARRAGEQQRDGASRPVASASSDKQASPLPAPTNNRTGALYYTFSIYTRYIILLVARRFSRDVRIK